ncbi:MAG: T9SS type A sorting domain-containing protein [Bacteroidetes bacterium]|nr:T9SS type A sorting domain-containing protein [Bacteroidota bacterium]
MNLRLQWLIFVLVGLLPSYASAQVNFSTVALVDTGMLILQGTYQGENIYVNNPFNAFRSQYSVIGATLNGKDIEGFSSSTFEVDLSEIKLKAYVNIELTYRKRGFRLPEVLNPGAIRSKSTFELVGQVEVDKEMIEWDTRGESSQEPYVIERDIGTSMPKWVLVGSLIGKGTPNLNEYAFKIDHYPGRNKYRIKQRDGVYRNKYTNIFYYTSDKQPVMVTDNRVSNELELSKQADYIIYDSKGNIVQEGNGQKVDVSSMVNGTYYIKIQNTTQSFVKKK